MAKKAAAAATDSSRQDPHQNKSLAIRLVYQDAPKAKAKQVIETVKEKYGHSVNTNLVYMIKTKMNLGKSKRKAKKAGRDVSTVAVTSSGLGSPAEWVEAIRLARKLIELTGNYATAASLLKAVDQ